MDRAGARVNRLPRWLLAALAIGPTLGLLVFYVWPFVTLVVEAVTTTALTDTFGRASTWEVVSFTAWQAVVSTVVTIVVGLAPAHVLARFEFRGRTVLVGLLTAMFVLPTVVMGAAFLALLPDALDRTVWAVIGAHVVFNLAVVVRTAGSASSRNNFSITSIGAFSSTPRAAASSPSAASVRIPSTRTAGV